MRIAKAEATPVRGPARPAWLTAPGASTGLAKSPVFQPPKHRPRPAPAAAPEIHGPRAAGRAARKVDGQSQALSPPCFSCAQKRAKAGASAAAALRHSATCPGRPGVRKRPAAGLALTAPGAGLRNGGGVGVGGEHGISRTCNGPPHLTFAIPEKRLSCPHRALLIHR